ncbi:jg27025 [Pararge aegeria aegeria]|uniref:Jg27025 protein n=1 Tax=Pararge aegeria aegeria TaxID=348720 RepID=A0A8S4SHS2_9NEOP|nr:jg27025 [Pararge aegeria aegeria]
MTSSARGSPIIAKYKLSRRGKKLQISDDQRTLIALPRDVPERTWAEILHKEEIDLMIFDVREEILEDTFNICYQKYMARQNSLFTVHCAAEAWLKLLNWYIILPSSCTEESLSSNVCAESEVLQNVTDYNTSEAISAKVTFVFYVVKAERISRAFYFKTPSVQVLYAYIQESTCSELKHTTPVHGPLRGAGDSAGERAKTKRRTEKSKVFSKSNMIGRSKGLLPPLAGDSRSKMSIISDCRLRNLRLDTQYEITSEKINTPPGEPVKRK